MSERSGPMIVRDPLWNTIRVDPVAARILDTPAFQRLRYIRQLGLAHLVYPGASHTRFDHALGVYHLATQATRLLSQQPDLPDDVWEGIELIPYAALLHDIGHFAFSHALEELEAEVSPGDHEDASRGFFESPELSAALDGLGDGAAGRILDLIRGRSGLPLGGLVSGGLDLDKMEYLRRDALFCGVPYGEVDVDRLLQGLTLLQDPRTGRWELGVHEKVISALESLLFSKYQMFRNVYWHHGVRAATALYKRIVEEAVRHDLMRREELVGPTDEELLYEIGRRAREAHGPWADRLVDEWLPALRNRRLPKRALELTAADLDGWTPYPWLGGDTPEKRALEDEIAEELGLAAGEVVIDFPLKPAMFQLDVLVQRRRGEVVRLGSSGIPGVIDLPKVAGELHRTARILRVFTFSPRTVDGESLLGRIGEPI